MPTNPDARLDMTEVFKLLDEAKKVARELHHQPLDTGIDNRSSDRDFRSQSAARNRRLLYGAHIIDAARVAMEGQYHRYKKSE